MIITVGDDFDVDIFCFVSERGVYGGEVDFVESAVDAGVGEVKSVEEGLFAVFAGAEID